MRIARLLMMLGLGLLAGACQSGGASGARPAPVPSLADVPLQTLPPQRLAPGQCALVLWRKSATAQRIFMAFSDPAVARIRVGGRELELARTDAEGERVFGHSPRQVYQGGGVTLGVDLEIDPDRGLLSGAVVPSGVIDFRQQGGASVILPVGGLIACQAQ